MTEKTVLDFYADWCIPCDQQDEYIDDLAGQVGDDVTIDKIDVEEQEDVANEYNVRSVPTVVVEIDGEPVEQFNGVTRPDEIQDALKR